MFGFNKIKKTAESENNKKKEILKSFLSNYKIENDDENIYFYISKYNNDFSKNPPGSLNNILLKDNAGRLGFFNEYRGNKEVYIQRLLLKAHERNIFFNNGKSSFNIFSVTSEDLIITKIAVAFENIHLFFYHGTESSSALSQITCNDYKVVASEKLAFPDIEIKYKYILNDIAKDDVFNNFKYNYSIIYQLHYNGKLVGSLYNNDFFHNEKRLTAAEITEIIDRKHKDILSLSELFNKELGTFDVN